MLSPKILEPDQLACCREMYERKRLLIDGDMGVGKTVMTYTVLNRLLNEFKIRAALVVAPNLVAQTSWPAEIKRWSHLRGLSVSILAGKPKKEILRSVVEDPADITVISINLFDWFCKELILFPDKPVTKKRLKPKRQWLVLPPEKRPHWRWDALAFDEVDHIKSPDANVTKCCHTIAPHIEYVYGMTGTPMPNSEMDLWAQAKFIDNGYLLGRTITHFRNHFFNYNGYNRKYSLRPGASEAIQQGVARLSHRIEKPPRDYQVRYVELRVSLPKAVMKQYKELAREYIIEVEKGNLGIDGSVNENLDELNDVEEIDAVNAAVLSGKLRQLATGSAYVTHEDESRHTVVLHDAKYDMVDELLTQTDEPVLLLYWFKADKERLKKRYPDAVFIAEEKSKSGVVERWDQGDIRLLCANPKSAGHGLNLQYKGRIIIWLTPQWSAGLWLQANARVDRRGQELDVLIYTIIGENTADEGVIKTVDMKVTNQKDMLNFLADDLRERLKVA